MAKDKPLTGFWRRAMNALCKRIAAQNLQKDHVLLGDILVFTKSNIDQFDF